MIEKLAIIAIAVVMVACSADEARTTEVPQEEFAAKSTEDEQSDAHTLYNLGRCYADGKGVPQDYQEAYAWANLAAMSSKPEYVQARDTIAAKLQPSDLSRAQARSRELLKRIRQKQNAKTNP